MLKLFGAGLHRSLNGPFAEGNKSRNREEVDGGEVLTMPQKQMAQAGSRPTSRAGYRVEPGTDSYQNEIKTSASKQSMTDK